MKKQRKLYKENNAKKLLALSCSAALAVSGLSGCGNRGMDVVHAQEEIAFMEDAVENLSNSGIITHSSTAGKEETVYVMMDADGKVSSTVVSEWLKNPTGAKQLTDTSTLKDIKTVKGTASYTQNQNRLNWVTDGSVTGSGNVLYGIRMLCMKKWIIMIPRYILCTNLHGRIWSG